MVRYSLQAVVSEVATRVDRTMFKAALIETSSESAMSAAVDRARSVIFPDLPSQHPGSGYSNLVYSAEGRLIQSIMCMMIPSTRVSACSVLPAAMQFPCDSSSRVPRDWLCTILRRYMIHQHLFPALRFIRNSIGQIPRPFLPPEKEDRDSRYTLS